MKRFVIFAIALLVCLQSFSQELKTVEPWTFKAHMAAKDCKQYVNEDDEDVYSAVVDVLAPNVDFKASGDVILSDSSITNGKRIFVRIPSKEKKIILNADGYLPYPISISSSTTHNLYLYQIVLQGKEELPQAFKDTVFIEKEVVKEVVKVVEKEVVVEKEKLVEVDASKDKTFLILNIDQPGATVSVDGRKTVLKGSEFNQSIKNGKHRIVVSKDYYIDTEFDVNLKGGAKAMDVSLHHVTGSLTVTVKNAPNLEMKLDNNALYSGVTRKGLVGKYTLTMEDGRRSKSRSIEINKGEDIVKRYRFSRRQLGYGFVGYNGSLDALAGLQFGGGRRMGWIADFSISPLAFTSTFGKLTLEDDAEISSKAFMLKDAGELPMLSAEEMMDYTDKGSYRVSGHFGLSWRWCKWFGIYASAGYGNHTNIYSFNDKPYHTEIAKGPEAVGGAFLKFGWLKLNGGYVYNFGPVDYSEYNFGLSICW